MEHRCLDFEGMRQQIFLELLRSYHAGVGVTHSAEPQEDVAYQLGCEAYAMTKMYFQTESGRKDL